MFFDLNKKKDKLHLLLGLRKILLDIDKAIKIIRETEEDANVIPNLMEGFGIDKIQAEFIADIRLRNINKEYILKRTQETEALENEIKKLEEIVKSKAKIRNIIIKELEQIIKKYPSERRTRIITADNVQQFDEEDHIEDYPVLLFLTREATSRRLCRSRGVCRRTISSKRAMRCSGRLRRPTRTKLSFSPICSRRTRRTCTI